MKPGRWNPTLRMTAGFMRNIHDPVYNPLREYILEIISNINKTTPDMFYFEEKGYEAGEDSERYWEHYFNR